MFCSGSDCKTRSASRTVRHRGPLTLNLNPKTYFRQNIISSQARRPALNISDMLQVYLGKWQETDVAVKVLQDMQHLAPSHPVQPQDPASLKDWSNRPQTSGPPPTAKGPEQEKDEQVTVQGLQGVTDMDGSIGVESQAEETPQAVAAMKTLEREVDVPSSFLSSESLLRLCLSRQNRPLPLVLLQMSCVHND